MTKKNLPASLFFLIFGLLLFFPAAFNAQSRSLRPFKERFVIKELRKIHSVQVTYQAVFGMGTFGALQNLSDANLIDAALASGNKFGYVWTITPFAPTATTPAKFVAQATPARYPKSGRSSFYIDENGEMHAADRAGQPATADDPIIDDCALFGISDNERCAISEMRALFSAQMTYQSTVGNGAFGSLDNLLNARLINRILGTGRAHGYCFVVYLTAPAPSTPAFFRVSAKPCDYGANGIRSFYIDVNGVLRGADKNGLDADQNDPPIEDIKNEN